MALILLSALAPADPTPAAAQTNTPSEKMIKGILDTLENAAAATPGTDGKISSEEELEFSLDQTDNLLSLTPAERASLRATYSIMLPKSQMELKLDYTSKEPATPDELTAFIRAIPQNSVPILPGTPEGDLTEDCDFSSETEGRRNAEGVPNTAMVLRRYAGHIIDKCDKDGDGKLQYDEWKDLPGTPQAADMDGDLVLEEYELLYYLARYAKGRTIAQPVPKRPKSVAQTVLKTDGPVLIQPLSAPIRRKTAQALEEEGAADREGLAMSEKEFKQFLEDSSGNAGDGDDSDLMDGAATEPGGRPIREFAASESETSGVPNWFHARDFNGDGQLSLREFSPTLSLQSTAMFGKMDINGDGLVTPEEAREFSASGPRSKEQRID